MDNKVMNNLEKVVKEKSNSRDMFKIIFTNEDGKDIEYEILATFKSSNNNKLYYVMTDGTKENNKLNISVFYVNYNEQLEEPSEVDERFYPVLDDEELNMVMEVFNKIKDEI